MKQGTGKTIVGGGKVEPRSTGVNPGAVGNIGIQNVRTNSQQMYTGRGYQAPMAGSSTHKSGSQGKH